jgi:hypothetical protein
MYCCPQLFRFFFFFFDDSCVIAKLYQQVKEINENLINRLRASAHANRKLEAAHLIFQAVSIWFEPIRVSYHIRRAVEEAAKRKAAKNLRHEDDDRFK